MQEIQRMTLKNRELNHLNVKQDSKFVIKHALNAVVLEIQYHINAQSALEIHWN